jgi:hypothetical protein
MKGVCVERQFNVFTKILAHPGGTSQSMEARLWGSSVLIRPLHFQLDLPAFGGEVSTAQDDMVQGVRTAAEGADFCLPLVIEPFFPASGDRVPDKVEVRSPELRLPGGAKPAQYWLNET